MSLPSIEHVSLHGKTVFIRSDLNVPMQDGQITNDTRIVASLPTIKYCLRKNAKVIVCSHLGRPENGFEPTLSLAPIARHLQSLLELEVQLASSIEATRALEPGQIMVLENIRFERGETKNSSALAQRLASHTDIFCLDAFGTAHRAHASTCGIAEYANGVCAGLLLEKEIGALEKIVDAPDRPLIAVIGGSKVSSKLEVLHNLAGVADTLIVGGGMANTFMLAAGYPVGKSLVEAALLDTARQIMDRVHVALPTDVMITKLIRADSAATVRQVDQVKADEIIVDIGPVTARRFAKEIIEHAKTVLWNGPLGIFEYPQFGEGTRVVGEAIASTNGYTVAGGGDTLAALDTYALTDHLDYISTGGGAFLEFIEGKTLPGIHALRSH